MMFRGLLLTCVITALVAAGRARAGDAGGEGDVPQGMVSKTTKIERPSLDKGEVGADQRAKVDQALVKLHGGELDAAEKLFDEAVAAIKAAMTDREATYVCADSAAQIEEYKKAYPDKKKVVWVDAALREALTAKAFIAAERHKWADALKTLDEAAAAAPFHPAPLCEKGYVLNVTKKNAEALAVYLAAIALCEKHESAKPNHGMALRGAGFAATELGDLAGAKKYYERSLEVEPDNQLAKDELAYIKEAEKKQAPAPEK